MNKVVEHNNSVHLFLFNTLYRRSNRNEGLEKRDALGGK